MDINHSAYLCVVETVRARQSALLVAARSPGELAKPQLEQTGRIHRALVLLAGLLLA
jgi:hypothetical protein